MDATEYVKNNLDVHRILEHYDFDKVKPSGNYYRACCAIHGGDEPTGFVINAETGLWSCHTGGCGSGDIFHIVQKIDKVSFPVAVHKVADVLGIDIEGLRITAQTSQRKKELREFLEAIKTTQREATEEYTQQGTALKVSKFKEFQPETIQHFNLQYFKEFYGHKTDGTPFTARERLAFPIIFEGKLVGYSLRATRNEKPKWIHQPSSIKTRNLLYNYDSVIGESVVVVVEGITDVWAYFEIGIPAVATYGAHITDEQKRMLLRLGCDLVFSFDGDDAGDDAQKVAFDLFNKTSNIRFVDLPRGTDPEQIPREELRKHYEQKRYKTL